MQAASMYPAYGNSLTYEPLYFGNHGDAGCVDVKFDLTSAHNFHQGKRYNVQQQQQQQAASLQFPPHSHQQLAYATGQNPIAYHHQQQSKLLSCTNETLSMPATANRCYTIPGVSSLSSFDPANSGVSRCQSAQFQTEQGQGRGPMQQISYPVPSGPVGCRRSTSMHGTSIEPTVSHAGGSPVMSAAGLISPPVNQKCMSPEFGGSGRINDVTSVTKLHNSFGSSVPAAVKQFTADLLMTSYPVSQHRYGGAMSEQHPLEYRGLLGLQSPPCHQLITSSTPPASAVPIYPWMRSLSSG